MEEDKVCGELYMTSFSGFFFVIFGSFVSFYEKLGFGGVEMKKIERGSTVDRKI